MRIFSLAFLSALCLAAAPGPCDLVTKAEVQAAAGAPVSDATVNKINPRFCDYKLGATGSAVSVMLTDKSPADSAARTVEALKKSKINAELVAGVGDGAYRSSPGYGMQQLGAFKGSKHVIVTALITGSPEARSKAVTDAVMKQALAKVP